MSAPGGSLWRNAVRWLPGLAISLLAVGLLLRLTNWQDIEQALAVMNPGWLPLALLFFLASLWLRAFAWTTLLQRRVPVKRAFLALNEGYLLNNVFPFRLGELGRALLLGQSNGLSPLYVLSTILIERVFDLAIAAGLLFSTVPLVLGMASARPFARGALVLSGLLLLALYFAARGRTRLVQYLERLAGRWSLLRSKVLPRLEALLDGLGMLTQPAEFFISVIFMAGSWLFGAAEFHILLNSGEIDAPFWWTGFVLGVLSLGIALPSGPAALGVYEAAVVGALSLLNVPAAPALAFAIVVHLMHILVTGVIGAYALFRDGETLSKLYQRVRRVEQ